MHRISGSSYVSPGYLSLLSLKPRQLLLAELAATPMEESRLDNVVGLKPQDEFILTCSIALWLENKGFSKVLKRLVSAAQIEGDDWKSKALNLNNIFSKYLDSCNNIPKDSKLGKKPVLTEKQGTTTASVISKDTSKKKKVENSAINETEIPPKDTMRIVKVNESKLMPKEEESGKTSDTLNGIDPEKVFDVTVNSVGAFGKQKKDKKQKKIKEKLGVADEITGNALTVVTEEKKKGVSSEFNFGKGNTEVIVKSKDEKKKKTRKVNGVTDNDVNCVDDGNGKLISEKNKDDIELRDGEVRPEENGGKIKMSIECLIDGKPEKVLAEAVVDAADELKKSFKKRKRLTSDTNETLPCLDVQAAESKRRKIKDAEPCILTSGDNGHTNGHDKEKNIKGTPKGTKDLVAKKTSESPDVDSQNATNKLHDPKSTTKQQKSSAEPKTANAFQRVKVDEVDFVDKRLQDNSYWAKGGAENGYGAKAQEVLGQVKGRGFRHEKTKKKRGSYRGGQIDNESHSIKFNYSDDE